LREIVLSGRQFTWANRRKTPTYEKLDRFLASVEWEQKFPLVSVRALTRSGSDHTPILLDSGDQAFIGKKANFSFELAWLKTEGFYDLVDREWKSISSGTNALDRWQNKIRHLRQFLHGWARSLSGKYKTEKERLLNIINILDKKAEITPLNEDERRTLRSTNDAVA
jgi:hypothetical protein